jgi:hypothetical protein
VKITANVLGVEQALNFDTMEQTCMLVFELFGQAMRVPITEDQMEELTVSAVNDKKRGPSTPTEHTATTAFEDAREGLDGAEPSPGAQEAEERPFSLVQSAGPVMASLSDGPPDSEMTPGGLEGIFGDEEKKVSTLRARSRPTRTVTQDEAGNPLVDGSPPPEQVEVRSNLPQVPGFDSEDFPAG